MSQNPRVQAQIELEAMSVDIGVARYREALQQEGTGGTSAGKALLKAAMTPVIDALREALKAAEAGVPSRAAAVHHMIHQLDAEQTAFLTAQAAIQHAEGIIPLQRVAVRLSMALEGALTLRQIELDQPALAADMARKLEAMADDSRRAFFIRKGGALASVGVFKWTDAERLRAGTYLLELFSQSTGLVTLDVVPARGGKTQTVVRPTEVCRKWLEEMHARCELLQPMRMPMVCRPRHWTTPFDGGFLSGRLRQPIVKTRSKGYLQTLRDWEMPLVYASVNTLQDTEWAVNEFVYGVVRTLWEAGREVAGLPTRDDVPLPARPWAEGETPEPSVLSEWKAKAARAYDATARAGSKRSQLVQKLFVAEAMMERGNSFHFVYNLDWRGRMYPVGPGLNPQGDDIAKGLLMFSHSAPLGDEGTFWLAVHGANTFGVDKVSFDERVEWVQANEEMILACGRDPLANTHWQDADSPFCFLAFCHEWSRLQDWVDHGGEQADFQSFLAVAFDGSCNGLQNFSAMLRDEVGGAATGLVPTHKPSDIYTKVAQAAQALIDAKAQEGDPVAARWVGRVTRSLAKRNTMTVPYGVTKRGMQGQLFEELKKEGLSENLREDAGFLAGINHEAIGQVVVAARLAMDWLREAAKVAASNSLPVRWTSPVGFLALQDYREELGEVADFKVLGRRFQLVLQKEGDKLNARKQALGIAPNFVHSLDAAHLMRTVLYCAQDGMKDFAMIHDSYGCHAGQASLLRDNLRQAFVDQYKGDVLATFRAELVEQLPEALVAELPPLPLMGSLELEGVLTSDYFFA
jgi:DNA-directed RNA polymerase